MKIMIFELDDNLILRKREDCVMSWGCQLIPINIIQADPPDHNKIPREDVIGVTVVLLTCAYRRQEFIRVGYYVNNEYVDQELKENPPPETDFEKVSISFSLNCVKVT